MAWTYVSGKGKPHSDSKKKKKKEEPTPSYTPKTKEEFLKERFPEYNPEAFHKPSSSKKKPSSSSDHKIEVKYFQQGEDPSQAKVKSAPGFEVTTFTKEQQKAYQQGVEGAKRIEAEIQAQKGSFFQKEIAHLKKGFKLEMAALGLTKPPEGIQVTGLTAVMPSSTWIRAGSTALQGWSVGKVGAPVVGQAIKNTKTVGLVTKALKTIFSTTALIAAGSWIGSVAFGLWGRAESPEPIAFPEQKFLIEQAIRTGDWSLVDEAEAAKAEVLDMNNWEKFIHGTPLGAIEGTLEKIKGAAAGAVIMSKLIADLKRQQAEGQTVEDYWRERREEQTAQEKLVIDYYNDERKKMLEWEQEAFEASREAQRREDRKFMKEEAAFWAKERAKQRELEAEDRRAVAEFWLAYRKEAQKISENARPSNLNFGLL